MHWIVFTEYESVAAEQKPKQYGATTYSDSKLVDALHKCMREPLFDWQVTP